MPSPAGMGSFPEKPSSPAPLPRGVAVQIGKLENRNPSFTGQLPVLEPAGCKRANDLGGGAVGLGFTEKVDVPGTFAPVSRPAKWNIWKHVDRRRARYEGAAADLGNRDRDGEPGARPHRIGAQLGNHKRLPRGRQPGPLARPHGKHSPGARQGAQGRAPPRPALRGDRRFRR
jgi:hypothetical protein